MRQCRTCTYWRAESVWDRTLANCELSAPCHRPYAHELTSEPGYLTVEWPHTYGTSGCRGHRRAWLAMTGLGVLRAWYWVKDALWKVKYRMTHRTVEW